MQLRYPLPRCRRSRPCRTRMPRYSTQSRNTRRQASPESSQERNRRLSCFSRATTTGKAVIFEATYQPLLFLSR